MSDQFSDRPSNRNTTNPRQMLAKDPAIHEPGRFDPFETLHRLLYTPPASLEMLCAKLQTSFASATPRIPEGAFMKRYVYALSSLNNIL